MSLNIRRDALPPIAKLSFTPSGNAFSPCPAAAALLDEKRIVCSILWIKIIQILFFSYNELYIVLLRIGKCFCQVTFVIFAWNF
jgi:hypothetical protein